MAGIYVHIPFCASRCIYCGFCSTTRLELRRRYVDALCMELRQRENYINERARTIYIGGGTPSQLSADDLLRLFDSLDCSGAVEVTIECNPDDVTPDYAELLGRLPVNRVSMGVQTFSDERLRFLRRRHDARQVPVAIERLRGAGLENLSIDLMYGFPDERLSDWHDDIDQALRLDVEHISAYGLMYEEGTPLYRLLEQGKIGEVDEELSLRMYSDLVGKLSDNGFEHYEISNFAKWKKGEAHASYRSQHNSSYWNQTPYLGVGAAAHSFDGKSRQWNTADIEAYICGMEQGRPVYEREETDRSTRYNDLVLTSLRTCEGLDLDLLSTDERNYCLEQAKRYIDDQRLRRVGTRLVLTRRGIFVSNMIMGDLMWVD